MRKLIKGVILGFVSFLLVAYLYPGFFFEKTEILLFSSIFFGSLIITLKPVLKLLSLPLNLFTFGLFSFFSGAILIYLVSFFIDGFSIVSFDFPTVMISGFTIPGIYVIPIFSALIASILISWLNTFLRWMFH